MSGVSREALRLLTLLNELQQAGLIGESDYITDTEGRDRPVVTNIVAFDGQLALRRQEEN